jgi:Tfp pilus assembly protein PilF
MLRRAIEALRAEEPRSAVDWALRALDHDERSGAAWHVLAVALERGGDFASSLKAYSAALDLAADPADVANDLGRLAYRMGMKETAEQLFRRHLERRPDAFEAANNLACALRDQGRLAEAIEVLRAAIRSGPTQPLLWNTLGSLVCEQGDAANAIIFFEEALRLDPGQAIARYNRGNARLALGDLQAALADCEAAMAGAAGGSDRTMMQLARATIRIALGRIGDGWDDYEARLSSDFAAGTRFLVDAPRWTPDAALAGKTLLVVGEQGLGDEVLFANVLPDVAAALGASGRLLIAVEPRLVSLFQRSFPAADVFAHATFDVGGRTVRGVPALEGRSDIDLWAPIASLLRRFRRRLEDFPDRPAFLRADAARVRHWKKALSKASAGRKVGLLWKSMKLDAARARYFSPFELWAGVLKAPGVSFVNVQYGDCAAEIEWARRELGVEIWTPPEIDLKHDLDDVAALTCALDLTLGFANATSNIAAACGAPAWIVSTPGAWTRLGESDRMAWYPQARVFLPPGFGRWEATMGEVAAALAAWR